MSSPTDYFSPVPEAGKPSPRVPYKAAATPPHTPIRLTSPSGRSMRGSSSTPGPIASGDYPESPTSMRIHYPKPPPFVLNPPKRHKRLPKLLRTPKRTLAYVGLLAFLGLLARVIVREGREGFKPERLWTIKREEVVREDDGLCRFVSPVEAYQRDLKRLRKRGALSDTFDPLVHPHPSNISGTPLHSPHQHQHHAHHTYSPTGHLLVSSEPDAPHPIPLLLALGEKRWEELLSRQSRTLEEAVTEYTRRYGRRPPKGFDIWWEFAMLHNLVLPDEYDRINLDLAPFFALPKEEMKRRMTMVEDMAETFTLIIENGRVDIQIKDEGGLEWGGTLPRAQDLAKLLRAFSRFLPNMRATFSIFDQPQIYLSWARRGSLVDLGLRGEHTTHLEETDSAHVKLSRSCAPDSNYRKNASFYEGKSFIYDSLEAGDPCQNPYLIPLHGLTIEPHGHDSHPRPHTQLLPLFSLAKTSINSDILITPLDQFNDNPGEDPEWENKTDSKLVWRGSPTGISMMSGDLNWREAHRIRLHRYANDRSTSYPISYIVPDLGQDDDEEDEMGYDGDIDDDDFHAELTGSDIDVDGGKSDLKRYVRAQVRAQGESAEDADNRIQREREREREKSRREKAEKAEHDAAHSAAGDPLHFLEEESPTDEALEFFFDMKLAGGPIQCSEEDGTCDDMRREMEWAPHQHANELNKHKFLLDIDGNGWSGRFRRLMSTKSVVIKTTIFTEWFQPHLIPWFMYIPAKLDFSDLPDILAFFRGTPQHPDLGFDETAKALGRNGQCFAERMFRIEDLQAYMMRLFLEYARIAADEGIDMDFYLEEEQENDERQIYEELVAEYGKRPSTGENDEEYRRVQVVPVDDLDGTGDMAQVHVGETEGVDVNMDWEER